jgi:tripartite-type tricarboxylate transporter receptor subunit TctC
MLVLAMLSSLLRRIGTLSFWNDRSRKSTAKILGNSRMTKIARTTRTAAAALLVLCTLACAAGAQSSADFYKGRQVTIMVGFTPGGSSSLYAQALARHMGRYLPGGPNFIVQHVPGAGGLVLANNIYNTVARDGLAFGITGRTAAIEPLLGNANAKFDGRRFGWIGTANVEYTTCTMWHTARVKTLCISLASASCGVKIPTRTFSATRE